MRTPPSAMRASGESTGSQRPAARERLATSDGASHIGQSLRLRKMNTMTLTGYEAARERFVLSAEAEGLIDVDDLLKGYCEELRATGQEDEADVREAGFAEAPALEHEVGDVVAEAEAGEAGAVFRDHRG